MTRTPKSNSLELVWPGKYHADGTVREPQYLAESFQTVEHYVGTVTGTENLLYWGDNLAVMASLQEELPGGIDLIYLDPPFATGDTFAMTIAMGEQGIRPKGAPTWKEAHAYQDKWESGSFCRMMMERLQLIHTLLAPTGSLFLHCDHRTDWALRAILEEVFGPGRVNNQIVWHYTGGGRSKRRFSRKHDTIFWATKSDKWTFHIDEIRVPYKPTSGYAKGGIVSASGKRYMPHPDGTPVDDVWDIPIVNPMSHERVDYPTQKPEQLLDRIIRVASNPGDLVADFFCGSGTTLAVAEKLGRRWLGCDQGHWAIHTARKRIASLSPRLPFSLLQTEHDVASRRQQESVGFLRVSLVEEGSTVQVQLDGIQWSKDFAIPDSVADVMTHWSDLLDSWAVDAHYDGHLFQPQWFAHRSRRQRHLPLLSEPLSTNGSGVLCIQTVDIFGHRLQQILS